MDTDFDFEFNESNTLYVAAFDSLYFVGHLRELADGGFVLMGAHRIEGDPHDLLNMKLSPAPDIPLCSHCTIYCIEDADLVRTTHASLYLNVAYINNIPFVCNSLRH